MATKTSSHSPSTRLQIGAALLAAAKAVDTKSVEIPLNAFGDAHRTYSEAHAKVEGAEARLRAEQARLVDLDRLQDEAVEAIAGALVADGRPRRNPFASFDAEAPSTIKELPLADEVKAIRALVASLQVDQSLSAATLAAAQRAEAAAEKVEAALPPLEILRAEILAARDRRDALVPQWDTSLRELRYLAQSAAVATAPGLYAALFGRPSRPERKSKTTAATTPPATPQPTPPPAAA